MIAEVINYNHILDLAIFGHFPKNFFEKLLEPSLSKYYF
jgi:hypothetical protein